MLHSLELSAHDIEPFLSNPLLKEYLQGREALLVDYISLSTQLKEVLDHQVMAISCGKVHGGVTHVGGNIIHVLTFSDHDSNHVQVTIFARFPNVCQKINQKCWYLRLKDFFTLSFLLMINAILP